RALSGQTAEVGEEISVPVPDAAPETEFKARIYQTQCAPCETTPTLRRASWRSSTTSPRFAAWTR
ncbi:MAG: hypothetical protein M3Y28_08750, partial [Armatimonadota bacterium]|nr:hypothetical protein [Armatimonadota bacterium]